MVHRLEECSGRELQQFIGEGTSTVVAPVGAIEHQGGHLPIGADALLADVVGAEVAQRLGAMLAPTLRVGCSERHVHLPGTVSLRAATLTAILVDQARGLARQGFSVVVLLSTNGGNTAALDSAEAELAASPTSAVVCAPRGDVGPDAGAHSGWWLTSVMLALRPDLVHLDKARIELATDLDRRRIPRP